MNSKQLIKQLELDGWSLRGVKGSHHIFTHPVKLGHISVPHPNGQGKELTQMIGIRQARSPHLNPLPLAGEEANESLRESHIKQDLGVGITHKLLKQA